MVATVMAGEGARVNVLPRCGITRPAMRGKPGGIGAFSPDLPVFAAAQITRTWVPIGVISKSSAMAELKSPIQPSELCRPILRVSCVPWIR